MLCQHQSSADAGEPMDEKMLLGSSAILYVILERNSGTPECFFSKAAVVRIR
jgi:hypothetical protein